MSDILHLKEAKQMVDDMEKAGDAYFLTFTLLPNWIGNKGVRRQIIPSITQIEQRLRIFTDKYVIVAELHGNGNIHYHACAQWAKDMQYAEEKMTDCMKYGQILGRWDHQKVKNGILEYLFKDVVKTDDIINYKHPKNKMDIIYTWFRPSKEVKTKPIKCYVFDPVPGQEDEDICLLTVKDNIKINNIYLNKMF